MVLRQPRQKIVLSLTPLIDVVFILLIFFMLASQFVDWRQIELTPQAQFSGAASDEQTSSLHLLSDGSFLVNGETVDGLPAVIVALKSLGSDRSIFLAPEDAIEIQSVIDVIEALNGAGLAKVELSKVAERLAP
ncbi:biopolymer transporter ExbD [Parvibaculaceae bacterium PLY_AMNH_Bact1]|nr:biopolymer transporter ExbD [Parvibaculaceae bacterium PLY_AMNH_Bact1]